MFAECGLEEVDDVQIKAVDPDHGLVIFLPMIMPRPVRRDDEIAALHQRALASHRSIAHVAFQHETQRGSRMAMRGGDLSGQNELHARIHGGGDARSARHGGVFKHQHAALRFFGGQQCARFHQ